jgi:hypothetical protein
VLLCLMLCGPTEREQLLPSAVVVVSYYCFGPSRRCHLKQKKLLYFVYQNQTDNSYHAVVAGTIIFDFCCVGARVVHRPEL